MRVTVKMEAYALLQMFAHAQLDGLELLVKLVRWLTIALQNPPSCTFIILTDINECNGDHNCDHNCDNVNGSYVCSCDPGYELQSDNRTCEGLK